MDLFKLFGTLALNGVDETKKQLDETADKASGLGDKLKTGIATAAKWGTAIGAGVVAVSAGVMKLAMNSAATADEVDKMSQKIGISKQAYQEWNYVLGQNGMEISSLQMGMKTLVTQMDGVVNGSASSAKAFETLGLSVTDSTGAMKDQETMMKEVLLALADMPNGTEKARLATELFGRSGSELMPLLNQGSGAIEELTERSHELGLIMSDEMVDAGVVLGDTMDDVKQAFGMVATELGAGLMPIVQTALDWVLVHMPEIKQIVSEVMTTIGALISALTPIIQAVFEGIGVLWETMLKPVLDGIITFLTGVFTLNFKQAWEGIVGVVKGIFSGLGGVVKAPLNTVIGLVNDFIRGLNGMKIPDWVPFFGGKGVNIPTIPLLAQGGILKKGQVGLLEGSGAEAVVPLDRNSAWVNAVARDMNTAIGGSQGDELLAAFNAFVQSLPRMLNEAFLEAVVGMNFNINNREFARMVKAVR